MTKITIALIILILLWIWLPIIKIIFWGLVIATLVFIFHKDKKLKDKKLKN